MLVTKHSTVLQHPTEPETTFTVRPISAGDMPMLIVRNGDIEVSFDLLAALVIDWTYDEPVTVDTIKALDLDTYLWITKAVLDASGIRSSQEKKDSETNSSGTSSTTDPSPESSDT